MADWSSGYVTEVGYTHGYYRELQPQLLAFAAMARGLQAPGFGTAPLRVLELGCGQGLSANIIAASNPHIDYTAVDFNPAHIANARAIASDAGLANLSLREASFEEVANDVVAHQYDIITLHGIYTWVSAENRSYIARIIRDQLRPGGLVYLSYNCFPAWAPVIPFRHLFTEIAGDHPGAPIFDRLDAALAMFERLKMAGVRSIVGSPGLVDRLERIKSQPKNYVAHELLNGEWTIFHFSDVSRDMGDVKLAFAASAHLPDHLDDINLTAEQSALLQGTKDVVRREGLRDLMMYQGFRRDIFLRGALPLGVLTARERLLELRFALLVPAADIELKITGALGEATLQAESYAPLLGALNQGPKTVRELLSDPAIAALGWIKLQQSLLVLVAKGVCDVALPSKGESERQKRTDAFNGTVLARARESADITFLASPVTGGGLSADRFSQLFLLARRQKEDPVNFLWSTLKSQGQYLLKAGRRLETDEENLSEIRDKYGAFERKFLPVLKMHRIAQ